ncbi:SusD/RagB family nutrient-binding outer membrane lipoprotein [Parapedobacter sp.]
MKKYLIILGVFTVSSSIMTSCKKSSFDDFYRDPSKVTEVTVDKQFAGMLYSYRELVVPSYWNYFVILRTTANRYIQATGWANEPNQLTPGAAAISDRWGTYYSGLAQFKELENVYNNAPTEEQQEKRIFYLAAKIFFYDQTQQIVDLHGDIPWTQAGTLNANGGDYSVSYPAYDSAEDIYTTMLDDLKAISTELNTLTIPSTIQNSFSTQDLINNGDLMLWKRYCNSLRLRMLTRVSDASSFSDRAQQELAEIVNNPSANPLVLANDDNIQLDVFSHETGINSTGLRDGIESWNANIAGKVMIDHMLDNEDPRLPFIFEPGAEADGDFQGLDQSLTSSVQTGLINDGVLSIYNRSTYSRNQYFPGIVITASEVNFLLSEYHTKNGNNAAAKTAFETGIKASIALVQDIRAVSNDNTTAAADAPTTGAVNAYISNIGWGTDNLQLIATQKWLHFNIIQPLESWAEIRRLDFPTFEFRVDPSDMQKTVPVKWNLPDSEPTYNGTNYQAVQANDNVNTKLFWDVN